MDVGRLSGFVIVRWLDGLVVWIDNGLPVDSRAAVVPAPLLACMTRYKDNDEDDDDDDVDIENF